MKANFKEPVADLNDLADVAKQDGRLDPLLLQLLRGVQVERLQKRFHTGDGCHNCFIDFTLTIVTIVSYLKVECLHTDFTPVIELLT